MKDTKRIAQNVILIGLIILFVVTAFCSFVWPLFRKMSNKPDEDTMKIVYSEAYTNRLREDVIKELYGSREQYATDHTGSRADYVDKEASMSGELVVDEERMQAVYDSKLKEFDSMIDNEKVDSIVKERQEQLVKDKAFEGFYAPEKSTSKEDMYWENGGKYFALVEMVILIGYCVYMKKNPRNLDS